MLWVLAVIALVWAVLTAEICAICAVGGMADDQVESWYREQRTAGDDVREDERGAA